MTLSADPSSLYVISETVSKHISSHPIRSGTCIGYRVHTPSEGGFNFVDSDYDSIYEFNMSIPISDLNQEKKESFSSIALGESYHGSVHNLSSEVRMDDGKSSPSSYPSIKSSRILGDLFLNGEILTRKEIVESEEKWDYASKASSKKVSTHFIKDRIMIEVAYPGEEEYDQSKRRYFASALTDSGCKGGPRVDPVGAAKFLKFCRAVS